MFFEGQSPLLFFFSYSLILMSLLCLLLLFSSLFYDLFLDQRGQGCPRRCGCFIYSSILAKAGGFQYLFLYSYLLFSTTFSLCVSCPVLSLGENGMSSVHGIQFCSDLCLVGQVWKHEHGMVYELDLCLCGLLFVAGMSMGSTRRCGCAILYRHRQFNPQRSRSFIDLLSFDTT